MRRAAAVLAFVLSMAAPAAASGDITCRSAGDTVTVTLGVGHTDTLSIFRTIVTIGEDTWSSDPAVMPGQPIASAQAYEADGVLLVDFAAEPAGPVVARLRAFSAAEADSFASGGVFTFKDRGAWAVDCSERG